MSQLMIDLDDFSDNAVVSLMQDLAEVMEGSTADVSASALVALVVVLGKKTQAYTKEQALAALAQAWDSVHA